MSGLVGQTASADVAPTITSANSTTFYVADDAEFSVTATGSPAPTFSTANTLPSSVTLASNGTLAGTPFSGAEGPHAFTITASNGVSPNATQVFTLIIADEIHVQPEDATVNEGDTASFDCTSADDDALVQWQYNDGSWHDLANGSFMGGTVSGATTHEGTLEIVTTLAMDGLTFRCKFTNGGDAPYDVIYSDVVSLTVVNVAPSGVSNTVITNESTAYTFATSDFGFSDVSDDFLAVKITTLPSVGSLTDNGVAVSAGDFIPVADVSGNLLVFTPVAAAYGYPYTTFTFQVQDDGGTAHGGIDTDATPRTMSVQVNAASPKTLTISSSPLTLSSIIPPGFYDSTIFFQGGGSAGATGTAPGTGGRRGGGGAAATIGAFRHKTGMSATLTLGAGSPVVGTGIVAAGGNSTVATSAQQLLGFAIGAPSHGVGSQGAGGAGASCFPATGAFSGASGSVGSPTSKGGGGGGSGGSASNGNAASGSTGGAAVTGGGAGGDGAGAAGGAGTVGGVPGGGGGGGGASLGLGAAGGSASAVMTFTQSQNHAPVGTANTVVTRTSTDYTFAATDFGFTDPNDTPAYNFLAVKITTLPATGTIKLSGVAVSAGDTVSVDDIDDDLLTFSPVAAGTGAPYTTFTFQVQDDGGTANSGVDLDATPRTMTINAGYAYPTGASSAISTAVSTAYTFATNDFGFSDTSDVAQTFSDVEILALPTCGALKDNAVSVTAGQYVPVADITGNKLVFTPVTGSYGVPHDAFAFRVKSSSGLVDRTPRIMQVNVSGATAVPVTWAVDAATSGTALKTAIEAASAGSEIQVSAGTFTLSADITTPAGVSITGSGTSGGSATIISTSASNGLKLGANATFKNFNIVATSGSTLGPLNDFGAAIAKAVVSNVKVTGIIDGIFLNANDSVLVIDCTFTSTYDTIRLAGGTITLNVFNTTFTIVGPNSQARAISSSTSGVTGTVVLVGCTISVTDGGTGPVLFITNAGLEIRSGTTLTAYACSISTSNAGGWTFDVFVGTGGTVHLYACTYNPSLVGNDGGTFTASDNLP